MALTVGVVKPLNPGTPTRRFLVPIILDGAATTATGLAHGITGAPGAPDRICANLGGSSVVTFTKVIPTAANPATQLDVTVSAVGTNTQTVFLELEWLTAF